MTAYKVKPGDVDSGRDVLVTHRAAAKDAISKMMEGGDRDWPALRNAVERYIEFQTALDVLAGHGVIDTSVPPSTKTGTE